MSNLDKLIASITKKHVYIQTHNYPDQDALAASYGLQVLLKNRNLSSTICYSGQIDKYNTQKMVELLTMDIVHESELEMTIEDEIILIDSQIGNKNVKELDGKVIACIDHHPMQEVKNYLFYDIRSDMGSCATIIGTYFIENKIPISKDVATALIYGIKMDTANLTRKVSPTDVHVFSHLFTLVDQEKLKLIESSTLRREDLVAFQDAIRNLKIYGRIAITKIGNDYSEAILGTISDFINTLADIDVTIVYTYRQKGLKFSVRSSSEKIDAGILIRHALGDLGDGGGHANMAAGFIPNVFSDMEIEDIGALVEQRAIEFVTKKK